MNKVKLIVLLGLVTLLFAVIKFYFQGVSKESDNSIPPDILDVEAYTNQPKANKTILTTDNSYEPNAKKISFSDLDKNSRKEKVSDYILKEPEETIELVAESSMVMNCISINEDTESDDPLEAIRDRLNDIENRGVTLSDQQKKRAYERYDFCKENGYLSASGTELSDIAKKLSSQAIEMGNERELIRRSQGVAFLTSSCSSNVDSSKTLELRRGAYASFESIANKGHKGSVYYMVEMLTDHKCMETYDVNAAEEILIKYLNIEYDEANEIIRKQINKHLERG